MPETPKEKGRVVDKILQQLNASWDLQLPRLHGKAAEAAESTNALAKKCSARIRYLCFRHEEPERLVTEFDGRARQLYAQWRFKPRQESGTLPILPIKKSGLGHDVSKRRGLGLIKLSGTERQGLLRLLDETLKDDYDLARDSDSFSVKPAPIIAPATASAFANAPAPAAHIPTVPRPNSISATPRTGPEACELSTVSIVPASAGRIVNAVVPSLPQEWPKMTKKRPSEGGSESKVRRNSPLNL